MGLWPRGLVFRPARLPLRRAWGVWLVVLAAGCSAGVPVQCERSSDCVVDRCQGEAACVSGRCVTTPAPVQCDATNDTACLVTRCDPADGQCVQTPRRDGLPCEDGEPCTWADQCAKGVCAAGAVNVCECAATADCADDGDLCNGVPFCDTSRFPYRCRVNPATVVACAAPTGCQQNVCASATGTCVEAPRPDGTPCDDGDACSANDACAKGACAAGEPVCGCKVDGDCSDPDGDVCTGVPYCDTSGGGGGVCKPNPASAVACSSKLDTPCRKNVCQPSTGACALSAVDDKATCDDGDPCTTGETCAAGACTGGTDTCSCTDDSDCKAQDDGDLCNGTLFCQLSTGTCMVNPATVVSCPTAGDTACAKNVCVPKTGTCSVLARAAVKVQLCVSTQSGKQCAWTPADSTGAGPFACEDGDACTVGDTCAGTVCQAGKQACACQKDSDCLKEDDGDLCNGVPYCDLSVGACKANPGSAVFCSPAKDTACLKAACNPDTGGCALQPVQASCDDGDPCTVQDVCTPKGACAGQANSCDDGDPCTTDSCKGGCVHVAKVCDDGNACTTSACDASSGKCTVGTPRIAGTVCDADSDGCTVGDVCDGAGACVAGPQRLCPASGKPCLPLVCQSSGAHASACVAKAAADGTPCADDDPCVVGDVCAKGVCKAGSNPTRWVQTGGLSDATSGGVTLRANGDVVTASHRVLSGPDTWVVRWMTRTGATRYPTVQLGAPSGSTLGDAMAVVDLGPAGVAVVGRVAQGSTKGSSFRLVSASGAAGAWVHVASAASAEVTAVEAHPSGNLVLGETVYAGTKPSGYRVRMVSLSGAPIWTTNVPGTLPHEVDDLSFTQVGGVVYSATSKQWNSSAKTYFPFAVGHLAANGVPHWHATLQAGHDPVRSSALVFDDHEFVFFSRDHSRSPRWNPFQLADDAPSGNRRHIGGTFHPTRARVVDGRALSIGDIGGAPALALHDRFGNQQWARTLALPKGTVLEDFDVDLTGQRVVVRGTLPKKAAIAGLRPVAVGAPVIASVSMWGSATCAGNDACGAKSHGDCDDGNPCTADGCLATSGCSHSVSGEQVCAPATGCGAYGTCSSKTCSEPLYGSLRVIGAVTSTKDRAMMTTVGSVDTGWWSSGSTLYGQTLLPDGSLAFKRAVDCPGLVDPVQMVTRADGLIFVLGKATKGGGAVCMFRHDTAVKPEVVVVGNCKGCSVKPQAMAVANDGRIAVATSTKAFGFNASVVTLLDYHVKQTASLPTFANGPVVVGGLTFDSFGTAVAVGYATNLAGSASSVRPWAMFRDGADKVKKQLDFKAVKKAQLHAVAPQDNGEFVGVGERAVSGGTAAFVLGISANAKASWSVIPSKATGERYLGVVQAQGGYIAAGEVVSGGVTKAFLSRRLSGNNGAVLWSFAHAYWGSSSMSVTPDSLLRTNDGRLLLGAQRVSNGVPLFVRASDFGFMSCSESGACASPSKTCDDKNACTADWCDPKAGCKGTPLSGGPCGVGGTCSAGQCVGG